MMKTVLQSLDRPHRIDSVLCSLAYKYREAADPLLDLKLDTSRKVNPGTCVQTYFWLVDRLPSSAQPELHQIRVWLEDLIDVVAFKPNRELFSRQTMMLGDDLSLEGYCTNVMHDFRKVTAHAPFDLELSFAFRECTTACSAAPVIPKRNISSTGRP